jgi:hypothetical protein
MQFQFHLIDNLDGFSSFFQIYLILAVFVHIEPIVINPTGVDFSGDRRCHVNPIIISEGGKT